MTGGEQHRAMIATNRTAETVAFLIGVVALGVQMFAESFTHLGFHLGPCTSVHRGIPWGVIAGSALLIAPKMIGRATAGKIILAGINALTLRLSGRGAATAVLTQKVNGESERPVMVASVPEGGGTAAATMGAPGEVSKASDVAKAGKAIEADA